jgi:beta-aspartyl-peptidase (threonine type)
MVNAISLRTLFRVLHPLAAAHEIAARLRYAGETLEAAAQAVVADIRRHGGEGGVIAVDHAGAVALPFNGPGMYRGMIGPEGVGLTAIYREELSAAFRDHPPV